MSPVRKLADLGWPIGTPLIASMSSGLAALPATNFGAPVAFAAASSIARCPSTNCGGST